MKRFIILITFLILVCCDISYAIDDNILSNIKNLKIYNDIDNIDVVDDISFDEKTDKFGSNIILMTVEYDVDDIYDEILKRANKHAKSKDEIQRLNVIYKNLDVISKLEDFDFESYKTIFEIEVTTKGDVREVKYNSYINGKELHIYKGHFYDDQIISYAYNFIYKEITLDNKKDIYELIKNIFNKGFIIVYDGYGCNSHLYNINFMDKDIEKESTQERSIKYEYISLNANHYKHESCDYGTGEKKVSVKYNLDNKDFEQIKIELNKYKRFKYINRDYELYKEVDTKNSYYFPIVLDFDNCIWIIYKNKIIISKSDRTTYLPSDGEVESWISKNNKLDDIEKNDINKEEDDEISRNESKDINMRLYSMEQIKLAIPGTYCVSDESYCFSFNEDNTGFFEGETNNFIEWNTVGNVMDLKIYGEEGSKQYDKVRINIISKNSFSLDGTTLTRVK